jgi:threonine aldolase
MDRIDLRSDTVTWPTPEMREAMASAEVGDDVKGEDPTINRLEALAAERTGKEAALFVSSGTQGNLIAILAHCQRGDEMICGGDAHTFAHEAGGAAALGGITTHTVPIQKDGTLKLSDIEKAYRDPTDAHYPRSRLVCLENTNGAVGGIPITAEYTRSVREVCDHYDLRLHIDGARIWNAAAALDCDLRDLTAPADSVSFCLSKGLCAPVGSLLCGSREFINAAHRIRKMLGGGMRQGGVLAAAGIIAIEKMTTRLRDDHATAKQLAEGLVKIDGIRLNPDQVKSNMVFFDLDDSVVLDAMELADQVAKKHNVWLDTRGPRAFRAVTHYWITPESIDTTLKAIRAESGAA